MIEIVFSTGPEGVFDPQGIAQVPSDLDGDAYTCCPRSCYCYDGEADQ